jgi:hypothetical protein
MPSDMTSDIQGMIKEAYCKLNVRGVGELLILGTVNKFFRSSIDELVLAIIDTPSSKTNLKLDASGWRWEKNANHRAADWIALGCVKFVRETKMRGEPQSKVYVRSFMYTMAHQMAARGGCKEQLQGRIAHALARSSQDWYSKDQEKRIAARDAFVKIATSRLAPGGQSLFPELSEEEIRKTLNLAIQSRV